MDLSLILCVMCLQELSAEVRARAEIESNIDGLSVDISLKECSATRRG